MGEGYKLKVMMTGIKKANDISLKKRERLDDLYRSYNHRRYVHPDPLEFLYGYPDIRDRELVALISSSLAYGRVAQILKSVAQILRKMDNRPWSFLLNTSKGAILSFSPISNIGSLPERRWHLCCWEPKGLSNLLALSMSALWQVFMTIRIAYFPASHTLSGNWATLFQR